MLFLIDPIESLHIKKDTSLALISAAEKKGYETFFILSNSITLNSGSLEFKATEISVNLTSETITTGKPLRLRESDVDVIFIRTDPPVDSDYINNCWLLSLCKHAKVVNNPNGILQVNEKIWASQFPNLTPTTLITKGQTQFSSFLSDHENIILKPTNGFGGQGIFKLSHGDSNANVAFETLSKKETDYVICQKYLPEAELGDKRILLVNGDPLGAINRIHSKTDHRNNFFAGGTAEKADITEQDLKIIETLKPFLVKLGLFFVGIDIIGNKLIEVNVTSPTCLREMNVFAGEALEEKVIDSL